MEKLVSIIIPAYNTEKYIGNCIESVIKQTYHNLEVIIVNDGSEDNTLEIITKARLRDNRIVVINQENIRILQGKILNILPIKKISIIE